MPYQDLAPLSGVSMLLAVSFTLSKIEWRIFHNPSPYAIRAVDQKAEKPGFDQKQ